MTDGWIDYNKTWRELRSQQYRNGTETALGAGVQIEVRANIHGGVERYLIGDINELGGVCDDCVRIDDRDIVVRYRVLLTKEQLA